MTVWPRELGRKSINLLHFACPWVRIQAQTENMSVIFFCADFSTFSHLKLAKHSFGGVHKQYGPKRERGRLFYPMYLMTWFIVQYLVHYSVCEYLSRPVSYHVLLF